MSERDPENLSERELLIEVNRQLADIRHLLRDAESEREAQYECETCGEVVGESDKEKHLRDSHKAPVNAIDIDGEYHEV